MVYLVGIGGLVGGFICGQMLLLFLLRHRTSADLKSDRSLRVYGFLNWLVALLGCVSMVYLYKMYFPS